MKKICSYLLTFTVLSSFCACGRLQSPEADNAAGEGEEIVVSSIQIEPTSKTMYAQLVIPQNDTSDEDNYWIGSLDDMNMKTTATDEGLQIQLYGFYTDDNAWNDTKVYKGFQSPDNSNTPLENVKIAANVTEIEGKDFQAVVDDGTNSVPIRLTPYTVNICPADDWREDKNFYNVIATDKDGNQYYMCSLPVMDDRKPSEKKANPLSNPIDLDDLGDGYSSAAELNYCGVRYAFNEAIDINNIEKIEIETFQSTPE